MIMQQCENCTKKGKNVYCNNCTKKADYFDVYSYDSSTRFDKGDIKGRIKAYTWHDVLEYIKDNFFNDRIKDNLNINCEKDFAYLEEIATEQNMTSSSTEKSQRENKLGYKVYLINEEKSFGSPAFTHSNFWDLTTVTANEDT
jgi:hypothetical protein